MSLHVVPSSLDEANSYVRQLHRHHGAVVGHKFSLAAADETGTVRGVAIIGRPVGRHMDDGWTLEVTRCCTDGVKNGCSILYSAAWRATRAMGYRKMITYVLASESGGSLIASGWKVLHETRGGSWSTPSRPRVDKHPLQRKICFGVGETSYAKTPD